MNEIKTKYEIRTLYLLIILQGITIVGLNHMNAKLSGAERNLNVKRYELADKRYEVTEKRFLTLYKDLDTMAENQLQIAENQVIIGKAVDKLRD